MCQFMHLAKIQGMKSISKPRLRIEISIFQEIMSANGYREKMLFSWSFQMIPIELRPKPKYFHRSNQQAAGMANVLYAGTSATMGIG